MGRRHNFGLIQHDYQDKPAIVVALWSSVSGDVPIRVAIGTTGLDLMGAPLSMTPDGQLLGFAVKDADGPVYLTFPKAPLVGAGTGGSAG
jgi:hypothetical protein